MKGRKKGRKGATRGRKIFRLGRRQTEKERLKRRYDIYFHAMKILSVG
jgi:hypothetical protein